jgi:hypothetical protein
VKPGAVKLLIRGGNYDPVIGMVAAELEDLWCSVNEGCGRIGSRERGFFLRLQKGHWTPRSHSGQCRRSCWAVPWLGRIAWGASSPASPALPARVRDRTVSPSCLAGVLFSKGVSGSSQLQGEETRLRATRHFDLAHRVSCTGTLPGTLPRIRQVTPP